MARVLLVLVAVSCLSKVSAFTVYLPKCSSFCLLPILRSQSTESPEGTAPDARATNPPASDVGVSAGSATAVADDDNENNGEDALTPPCFYRTEGGVGRWKRRVQIKDLKIGQKLEDCYVIEDLPTGRTGPKVWFECGVGRVRSNNKWCTISGMLRLPRAKKPVIKKKIEKLRKKESTDLYVSRIDVSAARLEVCLEEEDVGNYQKPKKIPISSLKPGQEVTGTVIKLLPYGVMVDVGANRNGLLHISTVANLYGRYIDKEKGLYKAGLERGAKVRLSVLSVEKRQLALDFTDDVKEEAEGEQKDQDDQIVENADAASATAPGTAAAHSLAATAVDQKSVGPALSEEELAAWAEFASQAASAPDSVIDDDMDEDEYEDDDYDEWDEQNDVEDALGLGNY